MKGKGLVLAVLLLGASGCASTAYKQALARYGHAGAAIEEDLKPASTDAQRMKYDAFHRAVEEAKRLGGE